MNKKTILALAGAALLLAGCEVSKEEVVKRSYNLIVHNTSSMACSTIVIDSVASDHGYSDVNFHQDNDKNVQCEDYNKTQGEDCEIVDLKSGDQGYGTYSCVLGTDKKPTKGDLARSYTESVDLVSESKANQ